MSIFTSILTGGDNNHETTAEYANGAQTDLIGEGVVGTITNTGGVAPATGAFAVNEQDTPAMAVDVSSGIAYVTATPTGQNSQNLRIRSTATEEVTIAANSSGSTKYDWIYISISAANAANPAVNADNVATLVTSRSTSISSDDGSPPTYGLLIAKVTVANGASSITDANITDSRTNITLLADIDDDIVTTSKIVDEAVTAPKIDFGGSGSGIWWEELGRGSGATISLTSIPARKYLRVIVFTSSASGSPFPFFRFNNDSGNNYARRYMNNFGGSESTDVSASGIGFVLGYAILDIINISSAEKIILITGSSAGSAGGGNLPLGRSMYAKWANTAAQITRIDISNGGTGALAADSQMIVLGHD